MKELPLLFPDLKCLILKGCYKLSPFTGISEIKHFKKMEGIFSLNIIERNLRFDLIELSIVNINSPAPGDTFGNIVTSIAMHCANIRFLRLCRCRLDNACVIYLIMKFKLVSSYFYRL